MKPGAGGEVSMDREKHFEAALEHLRRAITLLTVAGEDRLALAIEEIADWSDFPRKEGVVGGGEASAKTTIAR
jgi:hypothetical protein